MFGYVESPYTVEKAVQVAHGDRRIEIGLRASKLNGAERYIALEVFAADGMQLKDILLTYDGAAVWTYPDLTDTAGLDFQLTC